MLTITQNTQTPEPYRLTPSGLKTKFMTPLVLLFLHLDCVIF